MKAESFNATPIINVKLIEGAFRADQKRELLSKLTDAIVYPGLRDVTFVTIEEIKDGDWAIGGQSRTAQKVAGHAEKNLKNLEPCSQCGAVETGTLRDRRASFPTRMSNSIWFARAPFAIEPRERHSRLQSFTETAFAEYWSLAFIQTRGRSSAAERARNATRMIAED